MGHNIKKQSKSGSIFEVIIDGKCGLKLNITCDLSKVNKEVRENVVKVGYQWIGKLH
jgi:hypothetical protein